MSLKIYKDSQANAIFIEDANGVQFLNTLHTTVENGLCYIRDLARDVEIVSGVSHTDIVDENDVTYGATATEACNNLNALFHVSGSSGEVPVITSTTTVNLTTGDTLNYELTANYGVGYEWSNLPSGVTTVEGNVRKLIGGSGLSAGTYNITAKAINYFGEDSETISLVVSDPPFANTKSVRFSNQDWAGANAAQVEHVLGRSSNGSGSSDAWTIAFWYKASSENQGQVILYFGNNDTTNQGYIELRQTNLNGSKRLRLRYGSNVNYLQMSTPAGSLTAGTWQHIGITYDGGTTGVAEGSLSSYYGRFKIYIDNSLQTTNNTHNNNGWSGSIVGQNWRLGRLVSGNHMRQANIDELNLWDSDLSADMSDLYNSGSVFDTMTLSDQPAHRWRMGDGDTFPNLQDSGTEANCTFVMNNMTAADIVNDVPA